MGKLKKRIVVNVLSIIGYLLLMLSVYGYLSLMTWRWIPFTIGMGMIYWAGRVDGDARCYEQKKEEEECQNSQREEP